MKQTAKQRQDGISQGHKLAWARRKRIEILLVLCKELDVEMDGVRVPATAAAILNAIRGIVRSET